MGTELSTPGTSAAVKAPAGTDWITEIVLKNTAQVVGSSVAKRDALAKVRGEARYAADIERPGMVYGKAVRSPYARAR